MSPSGAAAAAGRSPCLWVQPRGGGSVQQTGPSSCSERGFPRSFAGFERDPPGRGPDGILGCRLPASEPRLSWAPPLPPQAAGLAARSTPARLPPAFSSHRLPSDGLLLLSLLLYAPVGLCLLLLRLFVGLHVFLVSCALPDSAPRRSEGDGPGVGVIPWVAPFL